MKQTQQGTKSTNMKSRYGRPSKIKQQSYRTDAMHNSISLTTEEPKNKKTNMVLCRHRYQKDSLQATRPENFPGCQIDECNTSVCSTFTFLTT